MRLWWLTFPLGRGFRFGISPRRSRLGFPISLGIRGGVSIPHTKRRRKYAIKVKEIGAPKIRTTGRMPGAMVDDD
jgi:hypothetical protein